MTLGLLTSFIITFTLLPTLINFVPQKNIYQKENSGSKITSYFAILAQNYQKIIFTTTGIVIILSFIGIILIVLAGTISAINGALVGKSR